MPELKLDANILALENFIHKVRSLNCEAKLKLFGAVNSTASKEAQLRHDAYNLAVEVLSELDVNLSIYLNKVF